MSPDPTQAPAVRLVLIEARHGALYRALHTCPDVMASVGPIPPSSVIEAQFQRVLHHNGRDAPGHRAWCVLVDGKEAGLVALLRFERSAEFGIMLLPEFWRRGIGTRVLAPVLEVAFSGLQLESVVLSRADDSHVAALDGICRPYGFVRTGGRRPGETGWQLDRKAWRLGDSRRRAGVG